jgi:pantetheine-phosphate adenylyltransferase
VLSALYPGTFDPLTLGHLDLVERGAKLFERLVVAVADNPRKRPVFTVDERVDMLRAHTAHLANVEVAAFRGLVVDYAAARGLGAILRGLRTASDFEYEYQMAMTNRAMRADVEAVFLMPAATYAFLSSSLIKEVVGAGGDASRWLPPSVHEALRQRLTAGGGAPG